MTKVFEEDGACYLCDGSGFFSRDEDIDAYLYACTNPKCPSKVSTEMTQNESEKEGCPKCGSKAARVGLRATTLMWFEPFTDEDGKLHKHDGNTGSEKRVCRMCEHAYYVPVEPTPCWCGWPANVVEKENPHFHWQMEEDPDLGKVAKLPRLGNISLHMEAGFLHVQRGTEEAVVVPIHVINKLLRYR